MPIGMHRRYPQHTGQLRPNIKKVANKVFGAAKAVGKVAVKPLKWAGKQIEKEWRGEDEAIEDFRNKERLK
jgi:hypothetical protein